MSVSVLTTVCVAVLLLRSAAAQLVVTDGVGFQGWAVGDGPLLEVSPMTNHSVQALPSQLYNPTSPFQLDDNHYIWVDTTKERSVNSISAKAQLSQLVQMLDAKDNRVHTLLTKLDAGASIIGVDDFVYIHNHTQILNCSIPDTFPSEMHCQVACQTANLTHYANSGVVLDLERSRIIYAVNFFNMSGGQMFSYLTLYGLSLNPSATPEELGVVPFCVGGSSGCSSPTLTLSSPAGLLFYQSYWGNILMVNLTTSTITARSLYEVYDQFYSVPVAMQFDPTANALYFVDDDGRVGSVGVSMYPEVNYPCGGVPTRVLGLQRLKSGEWLLSFLLKDSNSMQYAALQIRNASFGPSTVLSTTSGLTTMSNVQIDPASCDILWNGAKGSVYRGALNSTAQISEISPDLGVLQTTDPAAGVAFVTNKSGLFRVDLTTLAASQILSNANRSSVFVAFNHNRPSELVYITSDLTRIYYRDVNKAVLKLLVSMPGRQLQCIAADFNANPPVVFYLNCGFYDGSCSLNAVGVSGSPPKVRLMTYVSANQFPQDGALLATDGSHVYWVHVPTRSDGDAGHSLVYRMPYDSTTTDDKELVTTVPFVNGSAAVISIHVDHTGQLQDLFLLAGPFRHSRMLLHTTTTNASSRMLSAERLPQNSTDYLFTPLNPLSGSSTLFYSSTEQMVYFFDAEQLVLGKTPLPTPVLSGSPPDWRTAGVGAPYEATAYYSSLTGYNISGSVFDDVTGDLYFTADTAMNDSLPNIAVRTLYALRDGVPVQITYRYMRSWLPTSFGVDAKLGRWFTVTHSIYSTWAFAYIGFEDGEVHTTKCLLNEEPKMVVDAANNTVLYLSTSDYQRWSVVACSVTHNTTWVLFQNTNYSVSRPEQISFDATSSTLTAYSYRTVMRFPLSHPGSMTSFAVPNPLQYNPFIVAPQPSHSEQSSAWQIITGHGVFRGPYETRPAALQCYALGSNATGWTQFLANVPNIGSVSVDWDTLRRQRAGQTPKQLPAIHFVAMTFDGTDGKQNDKALVQTLFVVNPDGTDHRMIRASPPPRTVGESYFGGQTFSVAGRYECYSRTMSTSVFPWNNDGSIVCWDAITNSSFYVVEDLIGPAPSTFSLLPATSANTPPRLYWVTAVGQTAKLVTANSLTGAVLSVHAVPYPECANTQPNPQVLLSHDAAYLLCAGPPGWNDPSPRYLLQMTADGDTALLLNSTTLGNSSVAWTVPTDFAWTTSSAPLMADANDSTDVNIALLIRRSDQVHRLCLFNVNTKVLHSCAYAGGYPLAVQFVEGLQKCLAAIGRPTD